MNLPRSVLVLQLVDREYLPPFGLGDGEQLGDGIVVLAELGLVEQADGVGISQDRVLDDGVSEDIAQLLGDNHDLSPEFPDGLYRYRKVGRHERREVIAFRRGFLHDQGFPAVFAVAHLLQENVHDDERYDGKKYLVLFQIIDFDTYRSLLRVARSRWSLSTVPNSCPEWNLRST